MTDSVATSSSIKCVKCENAGTIAGEYLPELLPSYRRRTSSGLSTLLIFHIVQFNRCVSFSVLVLLLFGGGIEGVRSLSCLRMRGQERGILRGLLSRDDHSQVPLGSGQATRIQGEARGQ